MSNGIPNRVCHGLIVVSRWYQTLMAMLLILFTLLFVIDAACGIHALFHTP